MKIGILGGTFDPIHIGHLVIAQEALWQCELDRVLFMVTAQPPHKKAPRARAEDRYNMVELALQGITEFQPSRLEIERGGNSYTVQTLHELHRLYPAASHYWIVGGDSILEFQTWEDPEDVIRLANLIVAPRPGFDLSKVDPALRNKIIVLDAPQVDVSSTQIRRRITEKQPVRFLLPKIVEEYIYGHRLYLE
ncbi:MAG: nicotinate-nucleotide adenylyltransferase [Candidatus Abyssobacteria bacterium SURF_5]|uniref:Probable nicotinate-nucleotide adenylyltransferase n=1 Tax=Abyssobacteria bacterium (strain SURF_5) TaxID=2093360 RepID=A0A3A4NKU1_ABYX5|nr:MAG: nicotinate-nucleotide adenylyltransferase [Candidatus Abyssubacteria bacterium SURF_5]